MWLLARYHLPEMSALRHFSHVLTFTISFSCSLFQLFTTVNHLSSLPSPSKPHLVKTQKLDPHVFHAKLSSPSVYFFIQAFKSLIHFFFSKRTIANYNFLGEIIRKMVYNLNKIKLSQEQYNLLIRSERIAN